VVHADEDVPDDTHAIWQSGQYGVINHQPICARLLQEDSSRIIEHGGLYVVIASDRYYEWYQRGFFHFDYRRHFYPNGDQFKCSSWDFLGDLMLLDVNSQSGSEIDWLTAKNELAVLLRRGATGSQYQCTMQATGSLQKRWHPIAKTKYGQDVAGVIVGPDGNPSVVVIPELSALHEVLVEFLEHHVAEWRPHLFPHVESTKWVHRTEYELPSVVGLMEKAETVKRDAEVAVKNLESQIGQARKANESLYTLLTGTDRPLVLAVIDALKKVGFKDVVDMDAVEGNGGSGGDLREDVQVRDKRPTLVIDVKGVNGTPDDDESRQADKHAKMRRGTTGTVADFQPLTIINHQRKTPPRERNQQAYRDEIIKVADGENLGLMTTWDLYNILRNMASLAWPKESVLPIFYQVGRIDPVPKHYSQIGTVTRTWKPAFNVTPIQPVMVGDRIAVEVEETFREIEVTSLQVNKANVGTVAAGQECGVGCPDADKVIKKGARVFLIRSLTVKAS
jgi:hypothetical protein